MRWLGCWVFGVILGGTGIASAAGPEPPSVTSVTATSGDGVQPSTSRPPVLELLVGAGPRLRDIDFDVGDGSGGTQSRQFTSGAYADLAGFMVARPLARLPKTPAWGLVFQGEGGVGLGLRAEPGGTGSITGIRTWRALGQVGYLYPFRGFQAGGLVGVGADALDIDVNRVLPSIQYNYFRAGLAAAYTVVVEYLTIRVDGGLRKPFSLGDVEEAFGDQSSAIGWDAGALVSGHLDVGFAYGFRFTVESYTLDFAGTRENVPSAGGPGGRGIDRTLSFQFLVGWSL